MRKFTWLYLLVSASVLAGPAGDSALPNELSFNPGMSLGAGVLVGLFLSVLVGSGVVVFRVMYKVLD